MNKFIFLGRLTKDLELTKTANSEMTFLDLAVQRSMPDKNGQKATDFFRIAVFGKLANIAVKYLAKGRQVLVTGRTENRNYTDPQTNKKVYSMSFIAENIHFLDNKTNTSSNNDDGFVTIDTNDEDLPF